MAISFSRTAEGDIISDHHLIARVLGEALPYIDFPRCEKRYFQQNLQASAYTIIPSKPCENGKKAKSRTRTS